MVSRSEVLATLAIVLIGCTSTREIVDSRQGPTLTVALGAIQENSVVVRLRDGSEYDGDVVYSGPDSLALIVGSERERKSVLLDDVRTIRFTRHSSEYVFGGAVFGGAVGAGVGYAASVTGSSGGFGDMSGVGALVGGAVGLLVGGIVGGSIGSKTEYIFVDSPNEPVTITLKAGEKLWPQLTSDQDVSNLEIWSGDKKRTLSGDPIQVRFRGRSVFVTTTRADFLKAGIPVD
jgi:hypothetical protein